MTNGPYEPLIGSSGKGKRLAILKIRTVTGLQDYISGLEDRVEELSNFRAWAFPKIQQYEKECSKMKKDISELSAAKISLLCRIEVLTTLIEERGNNGGHGGGGEVQERSAQTPEGTVCEGQSKKREMTDCISPTTTSVPIDRYNAVRASPPCPPAGFWDKTSSKDRKTVKGLSAVTHRLRDTRQREILRFSFLLRKVSSSLHSEIH